MMHSGSSTDGPSQRHDAGSSGANGSGEPASRTAASHQTAYDDHPEGLSPRDPSAHALTDYRAPIPFAWQRGRQLLLLDEEPAGYWILAELWFDAERCRYVERRRAAYRWAREAIGALLSRALIGGGGAGEDASRRLATWYGAHHDSTHSVEHHSQSSH